jgi:hypothetical protein
VHKKKRQELKKIFFGLVLGFDTVCFFLEAIDLFNKVLKVFLGKNKMDWKWISKRKKNKQPCFFLPLQLSNFENFKQHIGYYFAIECNKRHIVRPINSRKKAHVHRLVLAGSRAGTCFVGQALDLAYQAHNTCPHSFYFSFIFFVNYWFLYVFLKNIFFRLCFG